MTFLSASGNTVIFLLDLKERKNNSRGNPRVYHPAQIYVLILKYYIEINQRILLVRIPLPKKKLLGL